MDKHYLLLSAFLFQAFFLFAQNNNGDNYQLHIRKALSSIKLDGILDEPDWENEEVADHFKLVFPNDTAYSKWLTEVRLTFDDKFLYVGGVCRQKQKDFTFQSLRRDFAGGTSDVLNIILGPASDGLNGFIFSVSPMNVQREGLIDNGQTMSLEWDNKWYSAVQTYDDHWTVEMAIPFKTLRYSVSPGQNEWQLQFIRTKVKDFEVGSWAPVPFQYDVINLAFAGKLIWETPPPKPGLNLSLIPYIIGGTSLDYVRDPNTQEITQRTTDYTGNIGGDAKVAITSGLNLDLTLNPDFSQVEVDRQVANLSRFELFFPETRQFFLENRDLFAMFGFPSTRPFFSRRIGLAYNPITGQNQKVPIMAGARLSGKINDGLRIGLLNMQTRRLDWDSSMVLPAANFTVATVQQKVFSRSAISAIFVNKQNNLEKLNEQQKDGWEPWNRVVGLEYNLYSKDNRWEGEWYYHRSLSPDEDKQGSTYAGFLGYRDRHFNIRMGYVSVDSTYTADAGFVPRPGVQSMFPGIGFNFYPKKSWQARHITQYNIGVDGDLSFGLNGQSTDRDISFYAGAGFKNQSYFSLGAFNRFVYLFEPFDPTNLYTPDTEPLPVGGYSNWGYNAEFTSGPSYAWQGAVEVNVGSFFEGNIVSVDGSLAYRAQPFGLISLLISYNHITQPRPFVSADLWLLGPRAELSFRRDLFASAFFQYNTQSNNFNLNARIQWRYAPVSDIFLVYTDNSFAEPIPSSRVKFLSPKNKAIVLKVVYWLNV
ncbi:MAG: DUF5916 domain-containing protein [Saprospiraceae bacterium]